MSNVYYEPEEFGLELFGALDEPDLSYEFNMVAVWRDLETNRLYFAGDSGCSCPSPFEDEGRADLTPLTRTKTNWDAFQVALNETKPWRYDYTDNREYEPTGGYHGMWLADKTDLEAKVLRHLREHGLE